MSAIDHNDRLTRMAREVLAEIADQIMRSMSGSGTVQRISGAY